MIAMSDTNNHMLADYADATPGWTHTNEGHHVVENPTFGRLEIGMVPGKPWDQWLFHENRGGGALVVGFTEDNKGLNVMMLRASRFNLNGNQNDWELPGGFVDNDDTTKLATGIRETIEETGQLADPNPVQGRGFVGNRAFFWLDGEHEGTSVFSFELTSEQVEAINSSDNLQLMTVKEAINATRDALTGMAIGRFVLNR